MQVAEQMEMDIRQAIMVKQQVREVLEVLAKELTIEAIINIPEGAGGGGWYGGGSGYSDTDKNARKYSGGGSGYVYTSSTASQYPSGCLLNSSYYLSNASTTGNSRSGNGCARITLVE